MSRFAVALGILVTSLCSTGCVGWGPCGDEAFRGPFRAAIDQMCTTCGDHCCSCDGYSPGGGLKRTLACGAGCGEVYYGEWTSNPPNTCNECDARGYAYGVNGRYPWLGYWWRPWGVKYRADGVGYGNPYRGTHPGMADYGSDRGAYWRAGLWNRMGYAAGVPASDCGCDSNAHFAPSMPAPTMSTPASPAPSSATPELKPIPNSATSQVGSPARARRVSYDSPLVKNPRSTTGSSSIGSSQPNTRNRASLRLPEQTSASGRLKQRKSLR